MHDFVIGDVVYERPIYGLDIAEELDISPQAVSQCLKRGLRKIYKYFKKNNKILTPVEIVSVMAVMLGVIYDSDEEISNFFKLFPDDLKEEVLDDAHDYTCQKISYSNVGLFSRINARNYLFDFAYTSGCDGYTL